MLERHQPQQTINETMAAFSVYTGAIAVAFSTLGYLWEPFFAALGFFLAVIAFITGAIALIINRGGAMACYGLFLGGICVIANVLTIVYLMALGLGHGG